MVILVSYLTIFRIFDREKNVLIENFISTGTESNAGANDEESLSILEDINEICIWGSGQ